MIFQIIYLNNFLFFGDKFHITDIIWFSQYISIYIYIHIYKIHIFKISNYLYFVLFRIFFHKYILSIILLSIIFIILIFLFFIPKFFLPKISHPQNPYPQISHVETPHHKIRSKASHPQISYYPDFSYDKILTYKLFKKSFTIFLAVNSPT